MTIGLAVLSALLFGVVTGAWLALEWMRRLRPGRESDLLAELAAVRANSRLHHAALTVREELWAAAGESGRGGPAAPAGRKPR